MATVTAGAPAPAVISPPVISALPTPFDEHLALDEPAFQLLCAGLPEDHRTVLVAGTTGEFPALTSQERTRLVELAVRELGPERVVAHVGAASLGQAVELAGRAAELGVRRVALLTPFYLPADRNQVLDHFARFTETHRGLATFAYLFPDRTGVGVPPSVFADVAALPGIVGVKLSGAANESFDDYLAALNPDQCLYSGDDRHVAAVRARGGTGVVSGCFPVLPEPFLPALAEPGPDVPARTQARVDTAVDLLGPSIAHQKLGLHLRTGRPWRCRMSMPSIDPGPAEAIRSLVAGWCSSTEAPRGPTG